uniref:Uncharacterized protein n=1 Tax=Oryzias latipes TaxID=8090 RepID=A0A3P9HBZ2_ORYLA
MTLGGGTMTGLESRTPDSPLPPRTTLRSSSLSFLERIYSVMGVTGLVKKTHHASARRVRQKFPSTTNTVAPRTPLRAPCLAFLSSPTPLARAAPGRSASSQVGGRSKSCLCRAIGLDTVRFVDEGRMCCYVWEPSDCHRPRSSM